MKYRIKFNENGIASVVYVLSNVLSKGIVFLTIPLFTRLLTTSEMGITTTFNSLCTLLFPILTFSVTTGTMQIGMNDYKKSKFMKDAYSAEVLIISSISTIVIGTLLFLFRKSLISILQINDVMFFIMILYCFFYAAVDIWSTRKRYEHKYMQYAVVSLLVTFLSTAVAISFVLYFRRNESINLGEIRILSQTIMIIIVSVFFYFFVLFEGKCYFKLKLCIDILKISWPLIFHSLAKNVLDVSDRLMVAYLCSSADAGIYGIIVGFSSIFSIIWNSIDAAIVPAVFSDIEKKDYKSAKEVTENALYVYAFISMIAVVVIPFFAKILTVEAYYDGITLIPILLLGNIFLAIYQIFGTFLLYKKKTIFIMYGTILSALINIILNMVMLKRFGYYAAAYTTVIAFIFQAVLQGVFCIKVYGESIISLKKLFAIVMICSIVCGVGAYIRYDNIIRCFLLIVPALMCFKIKRIVIRQS